MGLKLYCTPQSPGTFVKSQILHPSPAVVGSGTLGLDLRICICVTFPGDADADAAASGTTL